MFLSLFLCVAHACAGQSSFLPLFVGWLVRAGARHFACWLALQTLVRVQREDAYREDIYTGWCLSAADTHVFTSAVGAKWRLCDAVVRVLCICEREVMF